MNPTMRRFLTWILILVVLFFMTLAILAIWDVIDIQNIGKKSLYSLLVIFFGAVIILFITAIFGSGSSERKNIPPPQGPTPGR